MTTYREAIQLALRTALDRDPRVFILGEDIGCYGGTYAMTKGLLQEYGEARIRDTPLSESGFVGAAIGAALGGMRPIVEVMTVNFVLLALDQLVNTAATILHMSGGQFEVPLVVRMTTGAGRQLAAQHSHSFEGWLAHIPGLKILCPGTVEDARWMLGDALDDANPVLLFEHCMLFNETAELGMERPDNFNCWTATTRRQGSDITLITYGGMLPKVLAAAEALASDDIEAEVIDLRCLRPLDEEAILTSVQKTGRVVVIDEGWRSGSLAAEVVCRITESCFYDLRSPPARICTAEVPIPYPYHLEQAAIPQVGSIVRRAKEVVNETV
jgi:pyruvate dehydrogenase E1 component beta subunit